MEVPTASSSYTEDPPGSGLYQRPLTDGERGMIFGIEQPSIRELIRIHTFADFRSSQPTEKVIPAVRNAWKALRLLKSPDIATTFGDGFKRYRPCMGLELDQWLEQTFLVAEPKSTTEDVVREMQSNRDYLPVLYLVPQSNAGEAFCGSLILFISHWRTEAAGTFKMLDQIFDYTDDLLHGTVTSQALNSHTLGSEVHLLTPSLEDILMPDKESTDASKTRVRQHFDNFNAHLPQLDFPVQGDVGNPPSSTKLSRRRYTTASTSGLVGECRSHSISLTAAIHSAYLSAVWSIASPDSRQKNYASLMPAQVRTRLPKSSPYRSQGCWSAAQFLMLTARVGQDYMSRAKSLKSQYTLADQQTWLFEDTRETSAQMLNHLASMHAAPASMPWITSHGVLDREILMARHGDLQVDDVFVFADPLGPGVVFGLWSFKGMLNLEIHWNKSFHSDQVIESVLDGIEQVIDQELGIQLELDEKFLLEF
ncbi:hypothetical protein PV10_03705 [Exophiala mesophila]|uniref:Condensation domain-containing protein n=1 Tax=Exophiala mesophila TaxID=212818 RepID=A0A0D1WT77_EXOME|nr:uncharacterized protein PV10_03705 [Exophiala mesophila]KIV92405.1 hypothetical protein PV10_03705 [Exophiala mesophila]